MNKELDNQLEDKNIRPTAMRQLVLQILMEQDSAMSLTDLELQFENADKSTLYRTLKTFEDKKLIHSIDDGSGSVKYGLCEDSCTLEHRDHHIHFLCNNCQQTFCLNNTEVPKIYLPINFSAESINVVVKGICANCMN